MRRQPARRLRVRWCIAIAPLALSLPAAAPSHDTAVLHVADAEKLFAVVRRMSVDALSHVRRTASCHSCAAKYCAPVSRFSMGFRKREWLRICNESEMLPRQFECLTSHCAFDANGRIPENLGDFAWAATRARTLARARARCAPRTGPRPLRMVAMEIICGFPLAKTKLASARACARLRAPAGACARTGVRAQASALRRPSGTRSRRRSGCRGGARPR